MDAVIVVVFLVVVIGGLGFAVMMRSNARKYQNETPLERQVRQAKQQREYQDYKQRKQKNS